MFAGEPELTLVGCGLRALDHLTREAERSLRQARVIFYSIYNRDLLDLLRELSPQAKLIAQEDGEYIVGQYRPDIYRRIAERILAEVAQGAGVVALHPGSVTVVDAIAGQLLSRAEALGLRVRVVPGVSSIEFVLTALGWDISAGLQVILAQHLLLYRRRLDANQAAIIIQPGYYDTRWFAGAPLPQVERFRALQMHLADSYPPPTPMALVLAPIAQHEEARIVWFRLERLPELVSMLSPFHTLFIPPGVPLAPDPAFSARIESWDTLLEQVMLDDYGLPRQADARAWFDEQQVGCADDIWVESAALAAAWPRLRDALSCR